VFPCKLVVSRARLVKAALGEEVERLDSHLNELGSLEGLLHLSRARLVIAVLFQLLLAGPRR